MTRERRSILADLVALSEPTQELLDELDAYGWDSEVPLVVLTRVDLLSVLHRYLDGALEAEECRQWAHAVLGRDDIAFEDGWGSRLKEVLFTMSEPEINLPITSDGTHRRPSSGRQGGRDRNQSKRDAEHDRGRARA